MWHKFRTHFAAGLLVLAPLFFTVIFIGYLVKLTDQFVVNPLFRILPIEVDAASKVFLTKVAIAFFVLILVGLVGLAAEKFIFKKFFSAWEGFLTNIPFFNHIYMSIREVAQAFFGDKRGVFKRAVFVEYPRTGVYALGFITTEKHWEIHEKTGKDIVNVFIPSPPNPATGFYVFVPKEEVIDSDMTIEEAIRLVISGGAVVPPIKDKKE